MYIIYKKQTYASQSAASEAAKSLKTNNSLYICDAGVSPTKILFTLNNIPDGNCFGYQLNGSWYPAYLIHMNILRTRNKNIYDANNHYLIVDKI